MVSLNSEETEDREQREWMLGTMGFGEEGMESKAEASHVSRCSWVVTPAPRGPWVSTFHGGMWQEGKWESPGDSLCLLSRPALVALIPNGSHQNYRKWYIWGGFEIPIYFFKGLESNCRDDDYFSEIIAITLAGASELFSSPHVL